MRTIKFKLFTQTALESLTTDARTFGELKQAIKNSPNLVGKISFDNVQFIERETKVAYGNIEEAVLPAVDCIMFVTPTQTKLGATYPTLEEVDNMSYNELRSLGSKLNKEEMAGLDLSGKRADILEEILTYVKISILRDESQKASISEVNVLEKLDLISRYASEVKEEVSGLLLKANTPVVVEEPAVIKVTVEMLEAEAKTLAARFKK